MNLDYDTTMLGAIIALNIIVIVWNINWRYYVGFLVERNEFDNKNKIYRARILYAIMMIGVIYSSFDKIFLLNINFHNFFISILFSIFILFLYFIFDFFVRSLRNKHRE